MAVGRILPEPLRVALAVRVVSSLHWLFELTYRTRVRGEPAPPGGGRCIYALWHAGLWHVTTVLARRGVCAMVSSHRDGRVIAGVLERRGVGISRGSSTRGGARALLDFLRRGRDGATDFVVTVDGPRGPAREVKEGVLFAASRMDLPVVPVGLHVDRAWRTRSWDALVVGKPFARATIAFGEPLRIPSDAGRTALREEWATRLADVLQAAEEAAGAAETGPKAI